MTSVNGLLFMSLRLILVTIKPPKWQKKYLQDLKLILTPKREKGRFVPFNLFTFGYSLTCTFYSITGLLSGPPFPNYVIFYFWNLYYYIICINYKKNIHMHIQHNLLIKCFIGYQKLITYKSKFEVYFKSYNGLIYIF